LNTKGYKIPLNGGCAISRKNEACDNQTLWHFERRVKFKQNFNGAPLYISFSQQTSKSFYEKEGARIGRGGWDTNEGGVVGKQDYNVCDGGQAEKGK